MGISGLCRSSCEITSMKFNQVGSLTARRRMKFSKEEIVYWKKSEKHGSCDLKINIGVNLESFYSILKKKK